MRNPFVVGLLASGRPFAEREAEVQRLAQALAEPGRRLVAYGDARQGKSYALARAVEAARSRGVPAGIAALATAGDATEAGQRVLATVQQALGGGGRASIAGIAQRIDVTLEPARAAAESEPTFRFRFPVQPPSAASHLVPAVLDAVDAQLSSDGLVLGLALDEFQRVLEWGGEAAEWSLRESLARHRSIGYVLAGSRRARIEPLLTDPGRAFWQFTEVLAFGPLPAERLAAWITQEAARTSVTISVEASRLIVMLTNGRTRDVLRLAREVWFDVYTRGATDPYRLVQQSFDRVVGEQSTHYDALWRRLDGRERAVLRAFAALPGIQIMASESSRRFRLGPKSSVYSAVERLVEADHLARPAPGRYLIDDPFFRRWVQVHGLPDIGEATPPLLPPRESRPADALVYRAQACAAAVTPASRYSSTSPAL